MWEAHLQGADFLGAQLQGAKLWRAQLQGARLWMTQLQAANLRETQLQGADLQRVLLQGAKLVETQLQGTDLRGAQLQGISSFEKPAKTSFQNRISSRIGENSDFTNVVFSGGLDGSQVKKVIENMPLASPEDKRKMEDKLNRHVNKRVSHKLPNNSGATIGTYTKNDADTWIREYEEAKDFSPQSD